MGTLSGGGKETIKVGERCLIGANTGIGISLGDDCVVEAGCYVTAGARILFGRWSRGESERTLGPNGAVISTQLPERCA